MARLTRILIYPVKSLDGAEVVEARILPSGALEHDRRFALFDAEGQLINGKRTPRIHQLRSSVDMATRKLTLAAEDVNREFQIDTDRAELEECLSRFLGLAAHLEENAMAGFPDDSIASGPTIVGAATMDEVATWFEGLSPGEVRRRFRANLEIDGVEPFWEDRLYSDEGRAVRFQVGDVALDGTNPCQRCVVPTRSSETGERYHEFAQVFESRRYETLPYWATRSRFDHFYRLAVNTRPVPGREGTIRVGDEVKIVE